MGLDSILNRMKKQKNGKYKAVSKDGIVCIEMDDLAYKLLTGTLETEKRLKENL